MKVTWTTSVAHTVCVDVTNGELMTEEEIKEAIKNDDCNIVWVESPDTKEVLATAWYDLEHQDIDLDNDPLTDAEQSAVESGQPILSQYS